MLLELIGKCENDEDVKAIMNLLKEYGQKKLVNVVENDDGLILEVCPLGNIIACSDELYLSLQTNTDFVGAGYHDFVISFYEGFLKECEKMLEFEIVDPSMYAIKKDFKALSDLYREWMKQLVTNLEDKQDFEFLQFGLSDVNYVPIKQDGYVNTHMGRVALDDLKDDIDVLCDRFYIWNHQGKNAKFYRNCAYNLLYTQHYGDYVLMNDESEQVAHDIIAYFESAYACDHSLALSLDYYDDLCRLLGKKKGLEEAIFDEIAINSYRDGLVYYPIKNYYILVNGCSEISYDLTSDMTCIMAPYRSIDEGWSFFEQVSTTLPNNILTLFEDDKVETFDNIKVVSMQDEVGYHLYGLINNEEPLFMHMIYNDINKTDEYKKLILDTKYIA